MNKKLPLRDQLDANQKALEWLCRMAGKPAPPPAIVMKPKRAYASKPKSEIPSEHQEQCAFIKWFHLQHRGVRIFAIPMAAMRSPQLAAYLKAEGMAAGVPDLYIPKWRTWIEFKRVKGSVISDEQKSWERYLVDECGDRHFYAYGCDDAIRKIGEINAEIVRLDAEGGQSERMES